MWTKGVKWVSVLWKAVSSTMQYEGRRLMSWGQQNCSSNISKDTPNFPSPAVLVGKFNNNDILVLIEDPMDFSLLLTYWLNLLHKLTHETNKSKFYDTQFAPSYNSGELANIQDHWLSISQ